MLIIALIVLISLFFIPYEEIRIERIRAFGESMAVGTVVGKKIMNIDTMRIGDKIGNHVLTYRFIDPSGLARERSACVEIAFWNRVVPGDSVVVHFAKAEPGISRLQHELENSLVRFLAGFSRENDN